MLSTHCSLPPAIVGVHKIVNRKTGESLKGDKQARCLSCMRCAAMPCMPRSVLFYGAFAVRSSDCLLGELG